jgi:hypothetical protein
MPGPPGLPCVPIRRGRIRPLWTRLFSSLRVVEPWELQGASSTGSGRRDRNGWRSRTCSRWPGSRGSRASTRTWRPWRVPWCARARPAHSSRGVPLDLARSREECPASVAASRRRRGRIARAAASRTAPSRILPWSCATSSPAVAARRTTPCRMGRGSSSSSALPGCGAAAGRPTPPAPNGTWRDAPRLPTATWSPTATRGIPGPTSIASSSRRRHTRCSPDSWPARAPSARNGGSSTCAPSIRGPTNGRGRRPARPTTRAGSPGWR